MQSLSPSRDKRRNRRRALTSIFAAVAVVVGFLLWGALRVGPDPEVSIATDRPAIGPSTQVTASFSEPRRGLTRVKLELVQGERSVVLCENTVPSTSPFNPLGGAPSPQANLQAMVGTSTQPWLTEGEAVLRATAERLAGPLRSPAPVVVEKRLPVRVRPPRLEVLSRQHYVRQGGAGAVLLRVGATATSSGVRAGDTRFVSFPLPEGASDERFVIYAAPWNLDNGADIVAFAEDDAGNVSETNFVDIFRTVRRRADRIEISDDFLARVVPPIVANTPGVGSGGTLLDQYLAINGTLRATNLARVAELSRRSEPRFLWSGPFLQLPNSQRRASFAQPRTYLYRGREVDHQTHLGLDLASTSQAPVPAPNSGTVLLAGWLGIYGNAVVIDHGYGLVSLCGHLSRVTVKEGDHVERGQTIAATGATGLAGGDHLHLEIFLQGTSVDPMEWLDAKWIRDNIASKIALP